MQENKLKSYLPHEYSRSSYDNSSFYKKMFVDDVATGIIPIRLNKDEDTIKITIDADKKDLKLVASILNSFNRHSRMHNTKELVKYAIESIARDISWYGDAIYEIYEVHNSDEKQIRFISLVPDKFFDFKFFYMQLPPKNKDKKLLPKFIANKSLWKISIPKNLQNIYSYKRILSSINKFDSLMPKAFKDNLYNGNNNYYNYDSKKYREKQFLYVNDLTSEWGWNQRSMSDELTTEFYKNYKYIKFNLSQAIFREHIVNELNNLFKKLNLEASIKIEGLATSKDYEQHIEKYISNDIGYDNVFDVAHGISPIN